MQNKTNKQARKQIKTARLSKTLKNETAKPAKFDVFAALFATSRFLWVSMKDQ